MALLWLISCLVMLFRSGLLLFTTADVSYCKNHLLMTFISTVDDDVDTDHLLTFAFGSLASEKLLPRY